MKTFIQILLLSLCFLFLWGQSFAAWSKVPEYYFKGFGTEPFWSIEINWYKAPYKEADFIQTNDTQAGINDNLIFTSTENAIKFEWEYISGEIIQEECIDDSKWDTHEYSIKVKRDDFTMRWCADKREKENSDNTHPATEDVRPVWWDRDAHGCMLWAGYRWYAVKQDCIRIFEVSLEEKAYNRYLELLDASSKAQQKKVYAVMQKYKKILSKYNAQKQANIHKKVIVRIDTILKKKPSSLLELIKFEIMQLN